MNEQGICKTNKKVLFSNETNFQKESGSQENHYIQPTISKHLLRKLCWGYVLEILLVRLSTPSV